MATLTLEPIETVDPAKPGLRERQRQARNEAILTATFELLAEKGFDATTLEDVAERVGISRQTLYHHFRSKDEVVLRAVITLVEQGIASIQNLDPSLPPLERVEGVIRWMLGLRFSPAPAAIARAKPALMPIKAHPDYLRVFDRRVAVIKEIVDAGQADGTITKAMPSLLIVQMLLALVCDARYEAVPDTTGLSNDTITDHVVSLFMRGIRA